MAEFFGSQLLQLRQSRTGIGFAKHHVETSNGYFLAIKQLVQQLRQLVSWPRPTPHFSQTFFVDVHHHNAWIKCFWHGCTQARVKDDVVDPVQKIDLDPPHHMENSHHHGQKSHQHPRQMLDPITHAPTFVAVLNGCVAFSKIGEAHAHAVGVMVSTNDNCDDCDKRSGLHKLHFGTGQFQHIAVV